MIKRPIEIVRGLSLPFYPMIPRLGRTLRTPKLLAGFWEEVQSDNGFWLVQPKLNGERVILAVVKNKLYLQDQEGETYRRAVRNAHDFLKLPDPLCLDGEVWQSNFYPSEVLAVAGKSFLPATAAEREVLAFQLMKQLNQPWMYDRPNRQWLSKRWHNLPQYIGVIKKRANSTYVLSDVPSQPSPDWLLRLWDNRRTSVCQAQPYTRRSRKSLTRGTNVSTVL